MSVKGCIFKGCAAVVVISVLAIGVTTYFTWKAAKAFSSKKPSIHPIARLSPGHEGELRLRIQEFETRTKANQDATIELSSDEINGLIAASAYAGKVHVVIENGHFTTHVSLPLDKVPGFAGEYFNGSLGMEFSIHSGLIAIKADHIEASGKTVPVRFMEPMQQTFQAFLNEIIQNDPETREIFSKVKKLRVKGNKLLIQTSPTIPED